MPDCNSEAAIASPLAPLVKECSAQEGDKELKEKTFLHGQAIMKKYHQVRHRIIRISFENLNAIRRNKGTKTKCSSDKKWAVTRLLPTK